MLKNIYKYIAIIIITVIISIAFTGTHSVQSVDDLAYAIALGLDVGDNENLKVTFQFTMPTASSESGSGEASPSVIDSVEANSIDSAISLMNTYVSKEINLSHCKVIIISEELAKKGIEKEIYSLVNKVQIRPDNNVIITTCTAKEYIESVSPSLENLVAKFYEILPRSSEYTGYTIDAELGEFFNKLVCETCQPTAILGNLASDDSKNSSSGSSDSKDSEKSGSAEKTQEADGSNEDEEAKNAEGSEKSEEQQKSKESEDSKKSEKSQGGSSGESEQGSKTKSAKNGIENIGTAVFKDDKLVGKLTSSETLAHLLLTSELKSCNISVNNPENENDKIDLLLTVNHSPKSEVYIANGIPYIKTSVTVDAKISSIDNLSQKMTEERLNKIEESASNYLKTLIYSYLYKTSKEFHSDIAGFGKYALGKFETMKEFEDYDWLNHYQYAFFEVETNVTIKSGFLLTGT